MNLTDAGDHAHRVLEQVRRGLPSQESDVVAQSWRRCLNEYSLNPAQAREPALTRRLGRGENRPRPGDGVALGLGRGACAGRGET